MEITLDEWIVHYIFDPEKRDMVFRFLERVFEKCDQFVTVRGESLDRKIWEMSKKSDKWKFEDRILVKWFLGSFRQNTEKFHILDESDTVQLPSDLETKISQDDLYLVRAALTRGGFILTTDQKLKTVLDQWNEITCEIVDEFLGHYDC